MSTLVHLQVNLRALTFSQNVDGVAFTELQILGALRSIVVESHHLVLDGPVLQGVFSLGGGGWGDDVLLPQEGTVR